MVSCLKQAQQNGADGAHTGGCRHSVLAALQLGDLFLEHPHGGVAGTGIVIAGDLTAEHTHGMVGTGKGKGRGLVNGSCQGSEVGIPVITSVNALRVEANAVQINLAHRTLLLIRNPLDLHGIRI